MWRSVSTLIFTALFMPVSTALAEGTPPTLSTSAVPDLWDPLYLAQANSQPAVEEAARSEQCLEFEAHYSAIKPDDIVCSQSID
jgi:hypothetical protein